MRKVYKYENATIIVLNTNAINLTIFQNATESFIRKVIKERITNGDSN